MKLITVIRLMPGKGKKKLIPVMGIKSANGYKELIFPILVLMFSTKEWKLDSWM
jgi:hypothetical protein